MKGTNSGLLANSTFFLSVSNIACWHILIKAVRINLDLTDHEGNQKAYVMNYRKRITNGDRVMKGYAKHIDLTAPRIEADDCSIM